MSTTRALIALRRGDTSDLPRIDAIMREAFDPRFGEAWTPSQCMGMTSLPGVWLTLASLDDEIAGFALARTTLDDGELLLLATRPELRRRGIGLALVRSVLRDAGERGADKLHLEVRSGNPAIALYRREGFTKIGVRRNYYSGPKGDHYDAQTFCRKITKE